MPMEVEVLERFVQLRVFIIELNDLRGSDRETFPKTIATLTKHLSKLTNLQCVELTQRPGNTSCTFEDRDIDHEDSIDFLKSLETLLNHNRKLKRINIFYPIHLQDFDIFANISLPKILGQDGESHLLNFFSLNCKSIRENSIDPNFLQNIYHCLERKDHLADKEIISTRNYKYKQGIPSMLPLLVLRLIQYLTLPKTLNLFKHSINLEEQIEFAEKINFGDFKNLLNSDFTMLLGISMEKNNRLQVIEMVNLNIYDVDIQVLVRSVGKLFDLQKLSFKRSTFMDKVTNMEKIVSQCQTLKELNFNMTNILPALWANSFFFDALAKNQTLKKLKVAAICQDTEDSKKLKLLLKALRLNSKLKYLNLSENYLTGACFHMLKDLFFRGQKNIKTFKFYLSSSDRLFNEMFLELQRFFEELVRRGSYTELKTLIVSKGNFIKFKQELGKKSEILYLGEQRQLTDIVFYLEKAKRYIEQIKCIVIRGRLGETKEFALYMNEFLKECINLQSIFIMKTNLGGLMRNCKNINMFRDLKTTQLQYVNLTCSDLKNPLVERIVCALRALLTIRKLVIIDNYEVDLPSLGNLFRLKKIRANVEDDYTI